MIGINKLNIPYFKKVNLDINNLFIKEYFNRTGSQIKHYISKERVNIVRNFIYCNKFEKIRIIEGNRFGIRLYRYGDSHEKK